MSQRYQPAHLRIEGDADFSSVAAKIADLKPSDFRFVVNSDIDRFAIEDYMPMATEALSAYLFASHNDAFIISQQSLIDTAKLSLRDLDLGARLVAVFHSVTLLQPELQRVDFSDVQEGEGDDMAVVQNERYTTRLSAHSRQAVVFTLEDGSEVRGKTKSSKGKKSQVKLEELDRVRLLSSTVTGITVEGREDADRAQTLAVEFWYNVLRSRELNDKAQVKLSKEALDPSGLFYPFFYGEEPLTRGTSRQARKFGPPEEAERYGIIKNSGLDPSQKKAALALARPLRSPQDRITLIVGPPGTGKTTCIRTFAQQWIHWVVLHANAQAAALAATDPAEPPGSSSEPQDEKIEPQAKDDDFRQRRKEEKKERQRLAKLSKSAPTPAQQEVPSPEIEAMSAISLEEKVPNVLQPETPRGGFSEATGIRRGEVLFGPDGGGEAHSRAESGQHDEGERTTAANEPPRRSRKDAKPIVQPEDILPSLWCVCQSNAAVKNIAESLKREGVAFKIFVSDTYFAEWHEHQYFELMANVIVTSGLSRDLSQVRQKLGRVCVFLATMSSLSSSRLDIAQVFEMRPIYALIVDEASQIVQGAYPHVLARHAQTLGRIAFFGDHLQLAPFGSDTVKGIDSAFELRHLQDDSIMLNRCYRLPDELGQFISEKVYSGKLQPHGPDRTLLESVRFVDVSSGRESKESTSLTNEAEARAICAFVENHLSRLAEDFRIVAPYTGQRDLIERTLKLHSLPWQDRVFTIDSFQGHEADTIIISLVRDGSASAGFLANSRRTNVLLSRCKRHMYIFTSRRFLGGEQGRKTLVGSLAEAAGASVWADEEDVGSGNDLLGSD